MSSVQAVKIGFSVGSLKVIRALPPNKHGHRQWLCRCSCGNEKIVVCQNLRRGDHKSCGCKSAERRRRSATKHGGHGTPEYRVWKSMIARCKYKRPGDRRYAGRGIGVSSKWTRSFAAFLKEVGPRPGPEYSLDRFPNGDGDYEPGNVRWATLDQQTANKGNRIVIEFDGREMFLRDAAPLMGIPYRTAYDRYRSGKIVGWRRDGQPSGVE